MAHPKNDIRKKLDDYVSNVDTYSSSDWPFAIIKSATDSNIIVEKYQEHYKLFYLRVELWVQISPESTNTTR